MEYPDFPVISVIIAFLNEEMFLAEAIESVIQQEYQHWELILVDDGSTDKSTLIAQQYAKQFPTQIIYCEHTEHVNKGLSASRNYGIMQSTGQLIAILDADDIWLPNKLADQVAIFQKHPSIAMLAEASLYWYSWNGPEKEDHIILLGAPSGKVYRPTELLYLLYPLSTGAAPCPSGLMISRAAFLDSGGFEEIFTQERQLYEDQAFLNKIYLKERVYISAACNNKYRQRSGSIVQTVKEQGQYQEVRRYFLEWYKNFLQKNFIDDRRLNRLLFKALLPYRYPLLYKISNLSVKRFLSTFLRQ